MSGKTDAPQIDLSQNRWLQVSLGVLWLFTVSAITVRLLENQETFRLGLFVVSAVAYLIITANLLSRYYSRRGYRGYFLHQLFILTVMMFAARSTANAVWILFLPALSHAVLFLPFRQMVITLCAQLIIGCFPLLELPPKRMTNYLFSYGTTFLFSVGCSYAIRREHESRRQLHDAHIKLQAYAKNAGALAIAEERARLAREIHDGVAHHLMAANVLVEAGIALLPASSPSAAVTSLQKGQGQIRSALVELRDSISSRQYSLDNIELPARIRSLVDEGGFPATLHVRGATRRLTPEAEQAFFRIAQEALTNARKHAPGEVIQLVLDFTHPGQTSLRAENKEPVHTASGDGAFGLLSLRERLQRLGGTFHAGPDERGLFIVRAEISS